jgi:hypothetical protein
LGSYPDGLSLYPGQAQRSPQPAAKFIIADAANHADGITQPRNPHRLIRALASEKCLEVLPCDRFTDLRNTVCRNNQVEINATHHQNALAHRLRVRPSVNLMKQT